ncbi:MAG TPA: hypothetical protein VL443_03005, partial [Cyclobacteriaceae bacterium]|nr:hypothetical protein [Cyclobacteriaceae bacterium]
VYLPKDINGFRFENGRYYISSHTINYKEDIFLEFLLKGKVDLFYYRKEGNDFYLVKKDTTIIDLDHTTDTIYGSNGERYYHESTRYKGQLKALMSDSRELSYKSESVPYASRNLVNLMKEYHNQTCKPGEQCIEFFKKDTRLFDVRYGIFVCAGSPVLTLDKRLMDSYPEIAKWDFKGSGSKSFSAGFLIAIGMNSLTRKLSILAEPSYSLYRFKSDEQLKYTYPPSSGVRDWITFDINAIKLPISLQYTFKKAAWKIHPFLQAGAWYSYFVSKNSKMDYKFTLDNVPSTGSYKFALNSHQTGYLLSFGLEIPYKTDKLRIAVKYEKGSGIHAGADNPSATYKKFTSTKGFNLQLGYIF